MANEILAGGCQCGRVRYDLDSSHATFVVCHCGQCQKQSASAFGMAMVVKSDAVTLHSGNLQRWTRTADSGLAQHTFRCDTCGTRIWHGDKDVGDVLRVRAGALDGPVDLAKAIHIWADNRLPGVEIPKGAKQFGGNPS